MASSTLGQSIAWFVLWLMLWLRADTTKAGITAPNNSAATRRITSSFVRARGLTRGPVCLQPTRKRARRRLRCAREPVSASGLSGRRLCWPIVGLRLQRPTPGVKGVVHHHAVRQHLVVVLKVGGKPERDCKQAAALRRQIVARRVGAAHYSRELIERAILDAEDSQDRIERAALAFVRETGAFDVVSDRSGLGRDRKNIARRHIQKLGLRIDEAANEPRAGYAVDLWPLARHPSVDRIRPAQPGRQPSLHPAGNALVEVETAAPRAAQRRGRILADTLTLRAIGNDCSAGRQGVQPLRIVLRIATHRADDEAIVGVEVVATAN